MSVAPRTYIRVDDYVRHHLSMKRYLHSLRCAKTASDLCLRFSEDYGLSAEEGEFAGIAHDMARELEEAQLLEWARRDSYPPSEEELAAPALLHGKVAARMLYEKFGEEHEHILNAVRWHTYGHRDMGPLGMVVFIADYIEPGREHIDEGFYKDIMKRPSLEEMVLSILVEEFAHLREKGRRIVKSSLMLYDALIHSTVRSGV